MSAAGSFLPDLTPKPTLRDVIAGVSVALILIPQSLAYAEIAGVPEYIGLYAAALPPLLAAFYVSSPYLQTGPVAMTALLTFGALQSLATPGSVEYVQLAALLALVVGVIRIGFGVLKGGVIAFFMSQPVMLGFTAGAAILIVASQLPTALGVAAPGGSFLHRTWWAISHPGSWETGAVVLSLVTVTLVLAGRRISPLFPGVLVAVIVGLAYGIAFEYTGATVGEVPAGLPPLSLGLPWGRLTELIIPGVVIALVGFAEPSAIARTFAAQDRQRWSPDQEFLSQGIANIASGISGAFPVGGSFSRSSVNRLAGGRTRWSGAVTGAIVLMFLPFAGILRDLPRAVLGAIVIAAVVKLIRISALVQIFRYSKPQGIIAAVTFGATLLLSPQIEDAVIIGVGLGIAIHLWRELRTSVLVHYVDGTLTLRPSGVLFFGSAPRLEDALLDELHDHPETHRLVIDLEQLGRIDYTGARALRTLCDDAEQAGLSTEIAEPMPDHARRIIGKVFAEERPNFADYSKLADLARWRRTRPPSK